MMDDFDSVSWNIAAEDSEPNSQVAGTGKPSGESANEQPAPRQNPKTATSVEDQRSGRLITTVSEPQTENDGSKDAFVSYLVTTDTDFPTFTKSHIRVRRRFTDFVFLWKTLVRDFPASAVPPLPDKHKMEYVRGDRFGSDFTNRRAHSLHRFLKRLTLHPQLRKTSLLNIFLESPDWNAHMRLRPIRGSANNGEGGVFDGIADTFINAFSKVHKPDERFIKTLQRADKLDEDLGHVEKIIARVVRREHDLETDYSDLAAQFQKILSLEPNVDNEIKAFANASEDTSKSFKKLREHTDQDYLVSLRDMEAYIVALRGLLKSREQKQLDFEGLTDYLQKATTDRDILVATPHGTGLGAGGFLRSKLEDVRGVDHEQARRERIRKLEMRIEELSKEAEEANKVAEAFDEEVVREVADFERIKTLEMKDTLGGFADANINFYQSVIDNWEEMLRAVEKPNTAT